MNMMRVLLAGVVAFSALQAPPQTAAPSPSAFSADPTGWVDLLADTSLKEWVRVPLGPVGQLPASKADDPSPWKVDPSGVLVCEGDKAGHEMLRYTAEQGDFILHVEWKFTRLEGDNAYNAGVFVKAAADGAIWFQAQTGAAGGYLFGVVPGTPKPGRVNLRDKMVENRVKPAGEWNTYEIKAVGKTLTLWVNGAIVNDFAESEVALGYIGLEAEGYRIEFRNLKLKRLP